MDPNNSKLIDIESSANKHMDEAINSDAKVVEKSVQLRKEENTRAELSPSNRPESVHASKPTLVFAVAPEQYLRTSPRISKPYGAAKEVSDDRSEISADQQIVTKRENIKVTHEPRKEKMEELNVMNLTALLETQPEQHQYQSNVFRDIYSQKMFGRHDFSTFYNEDRLDEETVSQAGLDPGISPHKDFHQRSSISTQELKPLEMPHNEKSRQSIQSKRTNECEDQSKKFEEFLAPAHLSFKVGSSDHCRQDDISTVEHSNSSRSATLEENQLLIAYPCSPKFIGHRKFHSEDDAQSVDSNIFFDINRSLDSDYKVQSPIEETQCKSDNSKNFDKPEFDENSRLFTSVNVNFVGDLAAYINCELGNKNTLFAASSEDKR